MIWESIYKRVWIVFSNGECINENIANGSVGIQPNSSSKFNYNSKIIRMSYSIKLALSVIIKFLQDQF